VKGRREHRGDADLTNKNGRERSDSLALQPAASRNCVLFNLQTERSFRAAKSLIKPGRFRLRA